LSLRKTGGPYRTERPETLETGALDRTFGLLARLRNANS